ncbi:MAG: nitroreductase family protein [Cypionkella sp.]|nr:nitroreductase family protein [Cypionkella sp.]
MPHPPNPAAFEFLARRRSHPAKAFNGQVPDRAALEPILTAALRVPDHGMLTPWRILVLQRAALLRIAELAQARGVELGLDEVAIGKGRGQFARSHLAVVVLSTPEILHKVPSSEQVASAAALCMNIVNASYAAGWAAQWLTGWVAHDEILVNRASGPPLAKPWQASSTSAR